MSEATSYKIHCSECLKPVPDEATFCPFCGRAVMASTRAERARRQFGTGIARADDVDERDEGLGFERLRQYGFETYLAAAVVAAVALGVGVFAWFAIGPMAGSGGTGSLWKSQGAHAGGSAASNAADTPRSEDSTERLAAHGVEVGTFDYEIGSDEVTDHQSSVIEYGGEPVVRLHTPKMTEYSDLGARSLGVALRLEWATRRHAALVSAGGNSQVAIRKAGSRHEVVWNDGDATYLLLRVHSEDVRHWNQHPDRHVNRRELAEYHAERIRALFARVESGSKV